MITIWVRAFTPVDPPSKLLALGMLVIALVVILIPQVWRVMRHVITITHEASHAITALLMGRRIKSIRLHSDTSGLTTSWGRERGFGMIMTAFAGYIGPGILGLGAARLLMLGYAAGILWIFIGLLGLVLLHIRNWFGLWSIFVSSTILLSVACFLGPAIQSAVAYALTWFLLFGAVRPVIELQIQRTRGKAGKSDADTLAKITHIGGAFWVFMFFVITLSTLLIGGVWILQTPF